MEIFNVLIDPPLFLSVSLPLSFSLAPVLSRRQSRFFCTLVDDTYLSRTLLVKSLYNIYLFFQNMKR